MYHKITTYGGEYQLKDFFVKKHRQAPNKHNTFVGDATVKSPLQFIIQPYFF